MKHTVTFGSWGEYLAVATGTPAIERGSSRDMEWGSDCPATWDQAVMLATNGWPEGTAALNRVVSRINADIASKLETVQYLYDTTGVGFDIDRVLSGEPECWFYPEPHPVKVPGKILRIGVDICCSAGISARQITAKGIAVASLIQSLALAGIETELVMVHRITASYGNNTHMLTSVTTLKHPGQDLDLDRLAFALIHPASLRRIGFGWMESDPSITPEMRKMFSISRYGSYGYPTATMMDGFDLFLPGMPLIGLGDLSEGEITKWVVGHLAMFGVEIKGDGTMGDGR